MNGTYSLETFCNILQYKCLMLEIGRIVKHFLVRRLCSDVSPLSIFSVCLARMHHGLTSTPSPFRVRVAVLECCIQQEGAYGGVVPLDLLDVEFFDDSSLVLVYRIGGRDGQWREITHCSSTVLIMIN